MSGDEKLNTEPITKKSGKLQRIKGSFKRFWADKVLRRGAHWFITLSLLFCVLSAFFSVFKGKPENAFLFSASDKDQLVTFASSISSSSEPLSIFIWQNLSQQLRDDITTPSNATLVNKDKSGAIVEEFNNILRGNSIHDYERFRSVVRLGKEAHSLMGKSLQNEYERIQLNRLLLEAAYPDAIPKHRPNIGKGVSEPNTSVKPSNESYTADSSTLNTILWVSITALFCSFLGAFWGCWYKLPDPKRPFADGLMKAFHDDDGFTATLFAVVIGVLFVLALLNQFDKTSWNSWVKGIFENPGGLFALITGAATLVGTYLAVYSILEMKHTITSYEQLMSRLTYMIKKANRSGDEVSFLAYSPLTGAWNVREKYITELKDAFAFPETKIKVVCLNEEDHLKLLNKFDGKKTLEKGDVDHGMIKSFQEECFEKTLPIFSGGIKHQLSSGLFSEKHVNFRKQPTRLKWAEMPGYYIFVSPERAIVVVPVGIPRLFDPVFNSKASKSKKRDVPINVETLGFETTDRHIIQKLQHEFDRYYEELDLDETATESSTERSYDKSTTVQVTSGSSAITSAKSII